MVMMMLMSAQKKIMGEFTVKGWLKALGWGATAIMAAAVAAMAATSF